MSLSDFYYGVKQVEENNAESDEIRNARIVAAIIIQESLVVPRREKKL